MSDGRHGGTSHQPHDRDARRHSTATTVVPALYELKQAIESGIADPEAIKEAVDEYFEEHPEAMLQDGSVTLAKLNGGMYTLMSVEDVENLF